jgi:FtsH-binding integral membrane protein
VLLTIQLLVTIGIGYWGYNSVTFKAIFVNIPALIILTVLLIGLSCFIGCCLHEFRKCAIFIFIAFTIVFALLVGISICAYKSKIILLAAAITFALTLGLTAFACKNRLT